jgi:GntR family transcriptional regulator
MDTINTDLFERRCFMILLDYKDRRPLYEQIVERFQDLILKGALESEAKLPSVRNLAVDLSINPNTIQRAYSELEHLGYIYSVKGKGNFVSNAEEIIALKKKEFLKELQFLIKKAGLFGIGETLFFEYCKAIYQEARMEDFYDRDQ